MNLKGKKFKFCQDVPFISDEFGKPVDIGNPDRIFTISDIKYPHIILKLGIGSKKDNNKRYTGHFYIKPEELTEVWISTIYIDFLDDLRDKKIDEILQ
jgi:hypothetical protein